MGYKILYDPILDMEDRRSEMSARSYELMEGERQGRKQLDAISFNLALRI